MSEPGLGRARTGSGGARHCGPPTECAVNDGGGIGKGDTGVLLVDGKQVARGRIEQRQAAQQLRTANYRANNWERAGNTGVIRTDEHSGISRPDLGAPKFLGTIPGEFRGTATKCGPSARP